MAVVQLRVPDETKERWVAEAKGRGLSLTAYVLARVDAGQTALEAPAGSVDTPASEERMREIVREEIEAYVRRASERRAKEPQGTPRSSTPPAREEPVEEIPPEPPTPPTPPAESATGSPTSPSPPASRAVVHPPARVYEHTPQTCPRRMQHNSLRVCPLCGAASA